MRPIHPSIWEGFDIGRSSRTFGNCAVHFKIEGAREQRKPGTNKLPIFFFKYSGGQKLFNCCSAWSKSKSKEQNFGFGPKQNTKVTLENHHDEPKTFKEVQEKLELCIFV